MIKYFKWNRWAAVVSFLLLAYCSSSSKTVHTATTTTPNNNGTVSTVSTAYTTTFNTRDPATGQMQSFYYTYPSGGLVSNKTTLIPPTACQLDYCGNTGNGTGSAACTLPQVVCNSTSSSTNGCTLPLSSSATNASNLTSVTTLTYTPTYNNSSIPASSSAPATSAAAGIIQIQNGKCMTTAQQQAAICSAAASPGTISFCQAGYCTANPCDTVNCSQTGGPTFFVADTSLIGSSEVSSPVVSVTLPKSQACYTSYGTQINAQEATDLCTKNPHAYGCSSEKTVTQSLTITPTHLGSTSSQSMMPIKSLNCQRTLQVPSTLSSTTAAVSLASTSSTSPTLTWSSWTTSGNPGYIDDTHTGYQLKCEDQNIQTALNSMVSGNTSPATTTPYSQASTPTINLTSSEAIPQQIRTLTLLLGTQVNGPCSYVTWPVTLANTSACSPGANPMVAAASAATRCQPSLVQTTSNIDGSFNESNSSAHPTTWIIPTSNPTSTSQMGYGNASSNGDICVEYTLTNALHSVSTLNVSGTSVTLSLVEPTTDSQGNYYSSPFGLLCSQYLSSTMSSSNPLQWVASNFTYSVSGNYGGGNASSDNGTAVTNQSLLITSSLPNAYTLASGDPRLSYTLNNGLIGYLGATVSCQQTNVPFSSAVQAATPSLFYTTQLQTTAQ